MIPLGIELFFFWVPCSLVQFLKDDVSCPYPLQSVYFLSCNGFYENLSKSPRISNENGPSTKYVTTGYNTENDDYEQKYRTFFSSESQKQKGILTMSWIIYLAE